jgi:nucleoside-diphosphate-sugar epimerase
MKILITGVAGFIGSHMAEYLVEKGYSVEGIDNFNPYYSVKLKRINAELLSKKGVKIIEGDLCDDELYHQLDKNYHFIIHFAAQPGISATSSFDSYLKNNVVATHKLVDYAKQLQHFKQFINISTSSVYGTYASSSEDAIPAPTSYYGVSKLAAEQLVLAEARKGYFKACSLRLYSVYGSRERPDKLFTKLIQAGLNNSEFALFEGSRKHKRSFTYVDDIIIGIYACLKQHKATNLEVINMGHFEQETTENAILYVEKLLKTHIYIKLKPAREADQIETAAIITKARKILGYSPKTSLETGIKSQIDWYLKTTKEYGAI